MTRQINRFTDERHIFGLETFAHHVGRFEVHLSGEFAQTVHNAVAGDVDPVRQRYGVQGPTNESSTAARAHGLRDLSVRRHLAGRNRAHDVVDPFIEVHDPSYDRNFGA